MAPTPLTNTSSPKRCRSAPRCWLLSFNPSESPPIAVEQAAPANLHICLPQIIDRLFFQIVVTQMQYFLNRRLGRTSLADQGQNLLHVVNPIVLHDVLGVR